MNATMTERFNVAGRAAGQAVRTPERRGASPSARAPPGSATSASRPRCTGGRSSSRSPWWPRWRQALVYGLGGLLRDRGQLSAGTVVTLALLLTRLYGPLTALSNARVDVMSALVSFDRVFEVLDLAPMIARRRRRGGPAATTRAASSSGDVRLLLPERGRGVAGLARGRRRAGHDHRRTRCCTASRFRAEPGELVALVGPSGAGKTTISQLVPRIYDVRSGAVLVGGHDVRDGDAAVAARPIGVVSQDAHMFHDTIRGNLLYARPGGHRRRAVAALSTRRRSATWCVRCPTAWTPSSATAATGCPAARSSGWRSPGCCSRRRRSSILDEATAHLDSESEAAVQAALAEALAGRTSLVIAHRLSTIRHADTDPGGRRRPDRRARHARRAARRGRAVRRAVPHPVRAAGFAGACRVRAVGLSSTGLRRGGPESGGHRVGEQRREG